MTPGFDFVHVHGWGEALGSRKARGGFWLRCDRNRPALVILTESAVDAIPARSLRIEGTREHGERLQNN